MANRRFRWCLLVLALLSASLLGTGCVTNGRQVLLKEYGPSVPALAGEPLKGATIFIKGFDCAPSLVSLDLKTPPEEPSPFSYMDFNSEQDKLWDKEMHALQKKASRSDLREIGNMRNGFGMVMSHVYALNDPAVWLAEGLKYDLEAQGAKVVDASQAAGADITVSGTIQLCREDMYMVINGELVVDLVVQPGQRAPRRRQMHTHGATAAMLASEGEYFHALRDARQKFSILATREIVDAFRPNR